MDNKNKKSINEDVKFYDDGIGENTSEGYESKTDTNFTSKAGKKSGK